jgi:prepilin-type N-terminal cleavage/methylation domain-containing protein
VLRDGQAVNQMMRNGTRRTTREQGFTLVELMVAMTLFLILGGVVLSAVITMSRGLDEERVTSDISAEARVALERMARELRQANSLGSAQPTSVKLGIDFDGSGTNNGTLADPEVVTYAYDSGSHSIAMTAQDAGGSTVTEALLAGQVKDLTFSYTSSNWARDANGDGTVTLDEAGIDGVDRVDIRLVVERDGQEDVFTTEVTLRNRSQT